MEPSSTSTRFQPSDEIATVYDISVENNHNYFAEGVLVHNKPPPTGGTTGGIFGTGGRAQCSPPDIGACLDSEREFVYADYFHSVTGSTNGTLAMGGGGSAGEGGAGASSAVVELSFQSDDCGFPSGSVHFLWAEPGVSYEIWQSRAGLCRKDILVQSGAIDATSASAPFTVPSESYVTIRAALGPADCLVVIDSMSTPQPLEPISSEYCHAP